MIIKRIWELLRANAPRQQYYLEIGAYLLKKGAGYEIGKVAYTKKVCGKKRAVFVNNLYYDFKRNKITHSLSEKVI